MRHPPTPVLSHSPEREFGVVALTFYPSIQEAEAGGSL